MRTLRVGLAQINCTVGDLEGNYEKIGHYIDLGEEKGVDLLVFPELAITGYPPEDLLLKDQFVSDNQKVLKKIVDSTSKKEAVVIVGFVDGGKQKYNAAALIHNGSVIGLYHKIMLPNYGVFDEKRYFTPGSVYQVFEMDGVNIGINVCEDIWSPDGPAQIQSACGGAEMIVNINASPYHVGKGGERETLLKTRAKDTASIMVYVNMVGGQDELVFDGQSLIIDPLENLIARGRQFEEELIIADLRFDAISELRKQRQVLETDIYQDKEISVTNIPKSLEISGSASPSIAKLLGEEEEIYKALVLGIRDYVMKNGFIKVVIGLSGGIDSAMTAAIAAEAVGRDNVIAVFMPSEFSSKESEDDSAALAKNLGIKFMTIPITETFNQYKKMMAEAFMGAEPNIAEENIQARIRGNILMALSNKFGYLVLSTGNKSEMSVGYATLYGDMSGGFAVLKDVLKTIVYRIGHFLNENNEVEVIPERILTKAPTAELRPDQLDTDSLPPYETLDPILRSYIEEDKSIEEISSQGFEEALVKKIITLVDRSEYKRRQAPPGVKISVRSFGKDRRLPITNKYLG